MDYEDFVSERESRMKELEKIDPEFIKWAMETTHFIKKEGETLKHLTEDEKKRLLHYS